MTTSHNIIDTSSELNLYRFGNGIKLIRPDQLTKDKSSEVIRDTGHTVDSILQLPFPVYLEDTEHISIKSNEHTAIACGYDSLNDFIGQSGFKYFKQDTIGQKLINHRNVIKHNTLIISEEHALLQDDSAINTLSVRMPWYNDKNKIIGLFGCSIVLGKNSLAHSLTQIAKLGLLNLEHFQFKDLFIGSQRHSVYLTKRELQCLRLTVRGKPAKEVAYILGLSQRTIEEYLNNIKSKMNVSSKAELIDKAIDYFFNDTDDNIDK